MPKFLNRNILLGVIALIYLFLLFQKLGGHALLNWDEGIYAQVAKESMVHPLSFTYFGEPWHEKPPIMIWLVQISYLIFGFNELGARFFVPIFATGSLVFSSLAVRKIFSNHYAEILTAGGFLFATQFIHSSFFLNPDIFSVFFYSLALWAIANTKENNNYWYAYWIAIALGVLVKNIIGLIPVGLIFLSGRKFYIEKTFWKALILSALIVLPWHAIQTISYGTKFWKDYIGYHVLQRFKSGLENNGAPFWFYLDIFRGEILLSLLSGIGIVYFLYKGFRNKIYYIFVLNLFGIFLLLSSSSTKGYNYFLIAYPLLLSIIGVFLAEIFSLIKIKYLSFSSTTLILLIFIYNGITYNNFKIFKWSGPSSYEDNKLVAKFLEKRNEQIVSTGMQFAGPATWFYLNKKIFTYDRPSLSKSELVFHTASKNIYLKDNIIYISE